MSFIDNLRMNSIYGNPGELGPPNLNSGINLDEISGLLNRIHGYQHQRGQDELNNQLALIHAQQHSIPQGNTGQPVNTQPEFKFNLGSGASETFAKNILNPSGDVGDIRNKQLLEKRNEFGQTLAEKKNEFSGKQDINQQKVDVSGRRADTADWRASIADFKSKNPGSKILAPKGGNFQLVNPVTHEITDTKISTGSMTEKDRVELNNDNAMEQIAGRGAQQRETQGEGIAQKGNETRKTKQTPSGQAQLPTQTGRDQFNRAQELFNTDSELKGFVHTDPTTKTFIIDEPSTGFFGNAKGPSKEQYDKIREKIYGKSSTNKAKEPEKNDPLGIRPKE